MRKLLVLFIVISSVIIFKNTTYAELQGMNTDELVSIGKEVYERKGCAGCHKIAGAGGDLGPDLTNEGNILPHNIQWHKYHFKDPSLVVPGSMMPKIDLLAREEEALAVYMISLKSTDLPKDIEVSIKTAHEKLGEARKGIDEIKKSGFNVDALEVKYAQGWTRLETINNMIYTHNLAGVSRETDDAINITREIMQDVLSYQKELEHRVIVSIVFIVLIVIIVVLVFLKVLTV
ncbi:MAG: cbb3-type cytochrome c oxidase subunit II [Nitrospirota bacterium]